jgi:hypothetical protein
MKRLVDTLAVIPAFNEAARVGAVVHGVRAALPDADVLVVDDGSRDTTAEQARAAGARVVRHPFNLGYGAGLQTGYKWALRRGHRFVVQLDADGQHDPATIPRVLAPVQRGDADVVIGSRFVAPSGYEMGVTRSFGRRASQGLLRAFGGPRVADPTSGFQALARPVVRFYCSDIFPADFPDIDMILLLHRQGFRVAEVPVEMAPNPPGHASMHGGWRPLYYGYKMLLAMLRSHGVPRLAALRDGDGV